MKNQFLISRHNQLYIRKTLKFSGILKIYLPQRFIKAIDSIVSKMTFRNMLLLSASFYFLSILIFVLSLVGVVFLEIKPRDSYTPISAILFFLGLLTLPGDKTKRMDNLARYMYYFAAYYASIYPFIYYINAVLNQKHIVLLIHIGVVVLSLVFINLSIRLLLIIKNRILFVLNILRKHQGKFDSSIATLAAIVALIISTLQVIKIFT